MKKASPLILSEVALVVALICINNLWSPLKGQEVHRPSQQSLPLRPLTHAQGLAATLVASRPSFYQSRGNWQHIIDSTWGPGLPLASKLALFDAYAGAIGRNFDGFLSLGLNAQGWDSLRTYTRSRIDSTTSRGGFAAIMSRFAMSLRDAHTWAWDTVVFSTPLSPGVPLLILYPFATAEHFGAVLTALPDSTALVLRTVPNHPLGLQPGDIVLGYEGVPWKRLVRELLDAGIPAFSDGIGARSAETHALIRNAGNNWHLFQSIDILKHSTRDTLHLSVSPLLTLPSDPMMGNEQLDIPGIPSSFYRGWPWTPSGPLLTYGKLPGAKIGYIRLVGEYPANEADGIFATAIDSLWNQGGVVVDLRWNSGGWSVFDQAFAKMFADRLYTINDVYRTNVSTFDLTPAAHSEWFVIPGASASPYNRPLAVLLGPTCVSMGDITAQRLRYHPMARFFGKTSIASLGDNANVNGYPDWWLHYSISDMYPLSLPGDYLNRKEFPIDDPVWFNPDDVAQGIDPVLIRAADWITAADIDVQSISGALPRAFRLLQNYPNPFNPRTTIRFELPAASHVSLTVYDILGRTVSVLMNERRDAGIHRVTFDGSSLASGVYFYRLQAGDFVATKRLVIMR